MLWSTTLQRSNMKNAYLLLGLGIAGVTAYMISRHYNRKEKKSTAIIDDSNSSTRQLRPNPTSSNNLTANEQATIDGLNYGFPIRINESKVKAPLRLNRSNLIPNIYGDGVGDNVGFDGSSENSFYHNMSGADTVNMQVACKCAPAASLYKTDIPKLP